MSCNYEGKHNHRAFYIIAGEFIQIQQWFEHTLVEIQAFTSQIELNLSKFLVLINFFEGEYLKRQKAGQFNDPKFKFYSNDLKLVKELNTVGKEIVDKIKKLGPANQNAQVAKQYIEIYKTFAYDFLTILGAYIGGIFDEETLF